MTRGDEYHVFTLPSGLKCVHRATASDVSYSGIAVNAGSADDPAGLPGLAHFVEHTIFKGTASRNSWQINNMAESVGGELNAYTTKEETIIHLSMPGRYTPRALELLADLVGSATFPPKELDMEKEVVEEEINSYLDSPADSVFDEFEDRLYAGSGLGHNILGNCASLGRITSADCAAFIGKFYIPGNMVLFCSDSMPHSRFEKTAARLFSSLPPAPVPVRDGIPPMNAEFHVSIDRQSHQTNAILGGRLSDRHDPQRFALFLLNNHLGGPNMNSRLNRLLRDKHGYVYSVDSYLSLLRRCGHMQIAFGCDSSNTGRCLRLIRNELERLASSEPSETLLRRIKRQYTGQLLVGSDHNESMAVSMGKSLLHYGELHMPGYVEERIQEVTARQFRETAEAVASAVVSSLELL